MKNQKNSPDFWRGSDFFAPSQISQLQRAMDRVFDDFASPLWETSNRTENLRFLPPLDIKESGDKLLASMDLPGVPKGEIQVEVRDNQLIVSGERKYHNEDNSKGQHHRECSYGAFQRVLALPNGVNADQVEANFENGVLQISMPKAQGSTSKKISVGDRHLSGEKKSGQAA